MKELFVKKFCAGLKFVVLSIIFVGSSFYLILGIFIFFLFALKIIHKMLSLHMYKVRVLPSDYKCNEIIEECSSYSEAVERFLFYVHLALEMNLSVRCVNILNGKKSIKLFTNH